MRYSNNKDFQVYVKGLVSGGNWSFRTSGRKHGILQHRSGRKIPVPGTPGNHPRGLLNFKAQVRHVERGNTIN